MITPLDEYYNRNRNKQNFLASIFLGIIGAGVIALLIEFYIESLKGSTYWGYVPWILIFIFIILFYLAWSFSQQTEKMVFTYYISIDPETFESLIMTGLNEIPDHSQFKQDLQITLNDICRILIDPDINVDSSIHNLRLYIRKLREINKRIDEPSVQKIASSILNNLTALDTLCEAIILSLKGKTKDFPKKYTIKKIDSGIILKRFFLNNILAISFESNIEKSLIYPVCCITERSPFLKPREYTELIEIMHEIFNDICSENEFLKLGIKFNDIEEITFWDRIDKTIYQPLDREIKNNTGILEELGVSIEKANSCIKKILENTPQQNQER